MGPPGERYRTLHLCAVIDYYSKLVPHAEWYASEQLATLDLLILDEAHRPPDASLEELRLLGQLDFVSTIVDAEG